MGLHRACQRRCAPRCDAMNLQRYLSDEPSDRRRRQNRIAQRKSRAHKKSVRSRLTKQKVDNRTNRRAKRLPCCGKERRYCNCAVEVKHLFCQRSLQQMASYARTSPILTLRDAKDMAYILPVLHGCDVSFQRFIALSVLFRMYSKPETYQALSKFFDHAEPGGQDPDWDGLVCELASLYSSPQPVWGGMFYPSTLKAVRNNNGRWRQFRNHGNNQQRAVRDVHVFKVVWTALCKDNTAEAYLKARQQCSTTCWQGPAIRIARDSFAAWYDSFYNHLKQNTRGWFNDYAMKCILDVPCNCSIKLTMGSPVFPDTLMSKWPVNCPAYAKGIKNLFKTNVRNRRLNRNMKYKCLMYIHSVLSKKLGGPGVHRLSSTLAQLCWKKRSTSH